MKDPDPVFSRIRIRVTQKDRIRPDPDPQHWSKPRNETHAIKEIFYSVVDLVMKNLDSDTN